jgi:hypothetical protein
MGGGRGVCVGGSGGVAGLEMVMRPRAAIEYRGALGMVDEASGQIGGVRKATRHVACSPFARTTALDVARPMNRCR